MAEAQRRRPYPHRKRANEVWITCKHCKGTNCIKRGKTTAGRQFYWCKDCDRGFIKTRTFEVRPNDEYAKDVWDIRRLGIKPSVTTQSYTLNFKPITQSWLYEAVKTYIKYVLSTLSVSSAINKVGIFKKFSQYLREYHPALQPSHLSREVTTDFLLHLVARGLGPTTRAHYIGTLRDFLDLCHQNEWLPVGRYLIRDEDYPRRPKAVPRYIPEGVLSQLNAHIDDLPESVMRMTLVIMECGMRISELLHLKQDCLLQDKAGDWFLRYYQFKMKKEITVPVSREIVLVIQEQRSYVQKHLGLDYEYLFCARNGHVKPAFAPIAKPMSQASYIKYLHKLAEKHSIQDDSGRQWHFQTHQFRHTVGTRMINNGVPQHIIQRYLGHESPDMTAVYAQIHDQTMKEEVAKFRGRVVNIAGQVVEPNDVQADTAELQWFKRNIQAQALPNGSCALPTISKGCPHANACLTCTHFRTSAEYLGEHKKELEQTERLLEKALANGWVRQIEMNEKVKANLEAMVTSLEAQENESEA